jgi:hypothetical protein
MMTAMVLMTAAVILEAMMGVVIDASDYIQTYV